MPTRIGPNQNINLATNVTGTLPQANGGTNTSTFLPGHILRVSTASLDDSLSTTSNSFVTGIQLENIEPRNQGSKYLIQVQGGAPQVSFNAAMIIRCSVIENQQGSTNIVLTSNNREAVTVFGASEAAATDIQVQAPHNYIHIHEPANTSTLTRLDVRIEFANFTNTGTASFNNGNFAEMDGSVILTVMELAQ